MGSTSKDIASRQLLYLNPDKVRELHAQLSGGLPVARKSSASLAGRAGYEEFGGRFAVGAGRTVNTENEVTDPAIAAALVGVLERKRLLVSDSSSRRFASSIDRSIKSRRSFLACVSGRFTIPAAASIDQWVLSLTDPGYVSLFFDPTDERATHLRSKGYEAGIWIGMNTEYILERHKRDSRSSHLAVGLRAGQRWLALSAIGWVEGNGYLNPLVIYW